MTQNWAENQRNDIYHVSTPEAQETISIIQDLLDKSVTPESAAHDIATIYGPRLLQYEKISVYPFSLLSRAIIYPSTTLEDHQHIVELLLHLSKSPDAIVDGRPLKDNGRIHWRDIPEFSFWFSEEALHVHAIHDMDLGNCPLTWQEQAQQYKSANTFAALYLSALTPSITHEWKSMQCITRDTLTQALEVEIVTYSQIRRAGIYIPAAAQWILHSAPLIWNFCKRRDLCSENMEEREWIGGSDGSKALWKGGDGFNVERWMFWKERFADAAGLKRRGFAGRVVDDVVTHAKEAGIMMFAVEQEDAFALNGLAMVFDRDGVSS